MVVGGATGGNDINNITGGLESTGGVMLHNHKRKLRQRFDLIKKLGQGTYGKVQLGVNKETGQQVAIKTIKKAKIETEADLVRIKREIQIMSSVQHPYIIHIYEVFENREKIVLVMEYAAGGELYDYLSESKVLSEEEARRIFRQVASAVYYCHKHKICHRDLKLENILLDTEGNAKIADFGLSNVFDGKRMLTTFCGSPLYASPEIVRGIPYQGPEVDCWSLGVLLYTLVYGAMPFDGSNFKRLVKQICQGEYYEPRKPCPASPLIRLMLAVDASQRANIEDICSHWWVNQGYPGSCLELAEELANQTPVRLDLLLLLAEPPQSANCIMVEDEQQPTAQIPEGEAPSEPEKPSRKTSKSQSASSMAVKTIDDPMEGPSERKPKKRTKSEKRKRESQIETSQEIPSEQPHKRPAADEPDLAVPLETKSSPIVEQLPSPAKAVPEIKPEKVEEKVIEEIVKQCEVKTPVDVPPVGKSVEMEVESVPKSLTFVKSREPDSPNEDSGFQSIEPAPREPSMPKSATFTVQKEEVTEPEAEKPVSEPPKEPSPPKSDDSRRVSTEINRLSIGSAISDAMSEASRSETSGQVYSGTTTPGTLSPCRTAEKRQSRILRQAEIFNKICESQSDIKTMTLERPKKVTSFGFRVGDMKSRFETKAEPKKVVVASSFKVSDAKKAFEIAAAVNTQNTLPKVNTFPKRTIIQAPADVPTTFQKSPVKSQTSAVANKAAQDVKQSDDSVKSDSTQSASAKSAPAAVSKTGSAPPMQVESKQSSDLAEPAKNAAPAETPKKKPAVAPRACDIEPVKKVPAVGEVPEKVLPVSADKMSDKPSLSSIDEVSAARIVEKLPVKVAEKISLADKVPEKAPIPDKLSSTDKPSEKSLTTSVVKMRKQLSKEKTPASEEEEACVVVGGLGICVGKQGNTDKVGIKTEEQSVKIVRPRDRADGDKVDLRKVKEELKHPEEKQDKEEFVQPITPQIIPIKDEAKVKKVKPPPLDIQAAQQVETKVLIDSGDKELKEGVMLLSGSPALVTQKPQTTPRSAVSPPGVDNRQRTEIRVHMLSPPRAQNALPKPEPRPERVQSPPLITPKRERIIPIMVEGRDDSYSRETSVASEALSPERDSLPRTLPSQTERSLASEVSVSSPLSEGDNNLSAGVPRRESDRRDPIKKSPREFIIPISVEGGGVVTPKPGDGAEGTSTFGRRRNRQSHHGDDSRDSPFNTLKKLSSFGKGYFDEKEDEFVSFANRMQSRRFGRHLDHSDSSGEDDDDDTFQILTAESLFSNLLSRVRNISRRSHRDDPFASFRQTSRFESARGQEPSYDRPSAERSSRVFQRPSSVIDNVIRRSTESDASVLNRSSIHEDSLPWRRRQSSREPSVSSVQSENRGNEASGSSGRYPFQSVLRRSVAASQDEESQPAWTVVRLNSTSRDSSRKEYGRTKSSKELGEDSVTKRTIQRYGRAVTLDSIDVDESGMKRVGSPMSEDESRGETPISYRTYTRTCSREYLSPESDRSNWSYTLPNMRKSRCIEEEDTTKEAAVSNITAALAKPMQRLKSPPLNEATTFTPTPKPFVPQPAPRSQNGTAPADISPSRNVSETENVKNDTTVNNRGDTAVGKLGSPVHIIINRNPVQKIDAPVTVEAVSVNAPKDAAIVRTRVQQPVVNNVQKMGAPSTGGEAVPVCLPVKTAPKAEAPSSSGAMPIASAPSALNAPRMEAPASGGEVAPPFVPVANRNAPAPSSGGEMVPTSASFVPPMSTESVIAATRMVDEAAKLLAKAEAQIAERFSPLTPEVIPEPPATPKVAIRQRPGPTDSVAKRVSRFLRPDFYDTPKDQSEFVKQKELEIAEKSKSRFLKNVQKNWENYKWDEDAEKPTVHIAKVVSTNKIVENEAPSPTEKVNLNNSDSNSNPVVSPTYFNHKPTPYRPTSPPSVEFEPVRIISKNGPDTEFYETERNIPEPEIALAPLKIVTQQIRTAQSTKTPTKTEQKRPSPPSAIPKSKTPPRNAGILVNPPNKVVEKSKTQQKSLTPPKITVPHGATPPKTRGLTPPKVSTKKSASPPKNTTLKVNKEVTKISPDNSASKSSPKMKVKKHWENLMNLATSSFQKSATPVKPSKEEAVEIPVVREERRDDSQNRTETDISNSSTYTSTYSRTNGNTDSNYLNQNEVKYADVKSGDIDTFEYFNDTETPTSYDSRSVCSDLQSEKNLDDEESVSERILRKSFYTRFNDRRKSRRSATKEIIDLQQQLSDIAVRNRSSSREEERQHTRSESAEGRKISTGRRNASNFDSIKENDISVSFRERDRGSTLSPTRADTSKFPRTWRASQESVSTATSAPSEATSTEYKTYTRSSSRFGGDSSSSSSSRRYTAEVEANATIPRRNRYSVFEPTTTTHTPGSYSSRLGPSENRFDSNRYSTLLDDSNSNRSRLSSATRAVIGQSNTGLTLGRRDPSVIGGIASRDSSIPRRDFGFLRSTSTGYDSVYKRDSSLSSRLKKY